MRYKTLKTISSNIFNNRHSNYIQYHRWRAITHLNGAGLMSTWRMNTTAACTSHSMEYRKTVLELASVSFAFFRSATLVLSFIYFVANPIHFSVFAPVIFVYFMSCVFGLVIFTRACFNFRDILRCVYLLQPFLHAHVYFCVRDEW